jgi:hypothetical protein
MILLKYANLSETNDNSVAVLLIYGAACVLLAGDAEARQEGYMTSSSCTGPQTVVNVPNYKNTRGQVPRHPERWCSRDAFRVGERLSNPQSCVLRYVGRRSLYLRYVDLLSSARNCKVRFHALLLGDGAKRLKLARV